MQVSARERFFQGSFENLSFSLSLSHAHTHKALQKGNRAIYFENSGLLWKRAL